jgi:eukaryotic-like serine/threonine-protein kinase
VLGQILGSHRIVSKLGEGGMGSVYLAEHTLLGSQAAVKVLQPRHAADPVLVQRFFNEARAAGAIRHVGIVEIFDVGQLADGTSFIAMELLRGESLADRLGRGMMPIAATLSIGAQIASALAAAHQAGVVHRDLKPDNVFLLDDPQAPAGVRVKLLDFGIAKLLTEREPRVRTQVGVVLGTPTYMAPEQVRGDRDVDHRADLYALGCLLFRLLIGRAPFGGEIAAVMRAHVLEPVPSPRAIDDRVPVGLDQLVMALLAKDPRQRPSSDAVIAALGAPHAPFPPHAPRAPHTAAPVVDPRDRRTAIATAIAVLFVIVLGGIFGVWLGRRQRAAAATAAPASSWLIAPADGDGPCVRTPPRSPSSPALRERSPC